ncbi:ABC transporter permease [Marinilongibacter aquaticus]|uniref:ABC transporter permease n=1 Tax=Marinilongibacter aquaticus TaxID=2975157 RepID=UPI0021BD0F5D|nr:ABC transporter permease [Marinilongibacter aquaticus]UBM59208.1 ABC transporter permease [Marinilongibacter aquaticus]
MFIKLVLQKIWHKRLSSLLCILLMAIGVAIIVLVAKIGKQLESKFTGNISHVDMVIGAKGSPLQLILSAIFHIDAPTGNISLDEAQRFVAQNRLVKNFIPLAYGDNYRAYRIVGSNKKYQALYGATLAEGRNFDKEMEVVLGAETAQNLALRIGDHFQSAHGLDEEGEKHADKEYVVVGILQPSGSVLDRLILSNLESIWHIHEHGEAHAHEDEAHEDEAHEITAALVQFRSPMGMMTMPRMINQNTKMQAALPSIEINRLLSLFSSAITVCTYLAYLIVIVSGLSVFISLYNSLKEECDEKALMLCLGASRAKVFSLLLSEGLVLSVMGFVVGILISRFALYFIAQLSAKQYAITFDLWKFEPFEAYILLMAIIIGVISAALPSLGVYRLNLSKTLAKN